MKLSTRLIFFVSLFLLLCTGAFSDPLYMWHVSTDGSRMYMLGSIHALPEDFYPLPGFIEKISGEADLLVLETDIREEGLRTADLADLVFSLGYYQDGTNLQQHLPSDIYSRLSKYLASRKLPPEGFRLMKPWLLSVTLEVLELEKLGFTSALGLDRVLAERHTGNIAELEGFEYQVRLLSGLTDEEQFLLLKSVLDESENAAEYLNRFIHAWNTGNPELLESDLHGSEAAEDVMFRLITLRNSTMADRAEELLLGHQGTILLVAGAAHFSGGRGIPALMAERGYEVSQVMSDGSLIDFEVRR